MKMRSKIIWMVMAGFALSTPYASANWGGPGNGAGGKSAFAGCQWVVETDDREVTAECPGDSFVISGGCQFDQGTFRQSFPDGVSDGSSVREGDGWTCETTANQPVTAAALCCSGR